MKIRKLYIFSALILVLGLLLPLSGCTTRGNEQFRVVSRLETQKLCIGFRTGDAVGEIVSAALNVVAAEGTVSSISRRWFYEDRSKLKGDSAALDSFGEIPERTLLVGYDKGHMPYSGEDTNGTPMGFDIELAQAICEKLGWKLKLIAVNVGNAEIELKSGNVDCVLGGFAQEADNASLAFSPVYLENTVIIAALTGSGINAEGNLAGKTLAVSETGQFNSALQAKPVLVERLEYLIVLPGGADECFAALKNGACDAIVTDLAAIEYYR